MIILAIINDNDNIILDRDYTDIFSIKENTMDTLGKKYFPDVELSGLNVGLLGFTLEQIGNITEDSFNTASIMVNEIFPNKAIIPESIYSHAAIFQMDNIFSTPATCKFMMIIEEESLLKLATVDTSTQSYYTIDRNTVINVEGIPFTLDYDIDIIINKSSNGGYIYRAKYNKLLDDPADTSYDVSDPNNTNNPYNKITKHRGNTYINTISSNVNNPFLKLKVVSRDVNNDNKFIGNFILLEFVATQLRRTTYYDTITDNTKINFPILEFNFTGKLAGFDIFYKNPTDSNYTQLKKQIFYSVPSKEPFCYYRLKDSHTLLITFTSRNGYFKPDFNSDIRIDIYTTRGENGNFETYDGNVITVETSSERYPENTNLICTSKPISDSSGGNNAMNLASLQALTVEAYSTATELSTDSDILKYYYNYKYRYGTEMLVFKRRDDVFERLFSAFLVLKDSNQSIYSTNTLNLYLKLDDFDIKSDDINDPRILKPGHLFVYADNSNNKAVLLKNKWAYVKKDIEEIEKDPVTYPFVYTNPFLIQVSEAHNLITIYNTSLHEEIVLNYDLKSNGNFVASEDSSLYQYITGRIIVDRDIESASRYEFSLTVTLSNNVVMSKDSNNTDIINYLFDLNSDSDRKPLYPNNTTNTNINDTKSIGWCDDNAVHFEEGISITDNNIRVFLLFKNKTSNTNVGCIELFPTIPDNSLGDGYYKFSNYVYVDDNVSSKNEINVTNYNHDGEYSLFNAYSLYENTNNVSLDITEMNMEVVVYEKKSDYTGNIYFRILNGNDSNLVYTDSSYITDTPISIFKPINMMRSTLYVNTSDDQSNKSYNLSLIPFIKYNIINPDDKNVYNEFIQRFNNNYSYIEASLPLLRNNTSLDVKFYNTYGKSNNYIIKGLTKELMYHISIGDDNIDGYYDTNGNMYTSEYNFNRNIIDKVAVLTDTQIYSMIHNHTIEYNGNTIPVEELESNNYVDIESKINRVNVDIKFDIVFIQGTDLIEAINAVELYIKDYIESINTEGTNELYISNLIKNLETNFSYIHHLKFRGINEYDTSYQTIGVNRFDYKELTKEERRYYVPELLVINAGNNVGVIINASTL